MEKIRQAWVKNNSLVCVGLDPDPELMPDVNVAEFNRQIIQATSDLVCAYKPNLAFYEAMGKKGFDISIECFQLQNKVFLFHFLHPPYCSVEFNRINGF